jgi:DNA-binding MarR family transcriptional regulator
MATAVDGLDTLLALKAIGIAQGFLESDRRVAAVLIEHFNRKTGRCDPGMERVARLAGVSKRTVIRSLSRLETAGLFRRDRHGGHANCNSYEPVWAGFAEIERAWNARFSEASRANGLSPRSSGMSPASCQPSHLGSDSAVTQTCRTNLQKRTSEEGHSRKELVVPRPPDERWSAHRVRSGDAAEAAALRRWTDSLHQHFHHLPVTYGEIVEAITPKMADAATDAELRRRGAGIAYIAAQLRLGSLHAVPPPSSSRPHADQRDAEHG